MFSKVVGSFYISTIMCENSKYPTFLPPLVLSVLYILVILMDVKLYLMVI